MATIPEIEADAFASEFLCRLADFSARTPASGFFLGRTDLKQMMWCINCRSIRRQLCG